SAGSSSPERVVSVAVPVPALELLTYSVPDELPMPVVGARVRVPLGTRVVTGIVVANHEGAERSVLKPITELIDRESFVPPDLAGVAQWTAVYDAAGVGDAIPLRLPPMARGARVDAHKTRRVASITPAGLEALGEVTARQRDALALLAAAPDGLSTAEL